MKNLVLPVLVFISGGAVLAIEIAGTRILGPFYGVSLFLWSALITVTLVGLSAGYALGGQWADRGATMPRLYAILSGAGLWIVLIPWIKQPLLAVAEPLGLRAAVLTASAILFLPPLTLLGMVSPYAIRLRASSLEVVGRTAGNLYAISTVGSVAAALLTGFILIPRVGVNRLVLLIGGLLLLAAAIGLVGQRRQLRAAPLISVLLVLAPAAAWSARPVVEAGGEMGLVDIEQSPYAEIRVVDVNHKRHLLIDGGIHTIVDPLSWHSYFPYTSVVDLSRGFFEKPGNLLLVGLGGGSVVKNFSGLGWEVEAVEIDPVVTQVAYSHFGLDPSEGTVHQADGRRFLESRAKSYDLIVMDAFGSSSIPFHLVTREAFALVASRLKTGGLLAINLESSSWDDLIVRSFAATLMTRFEHVLALPTHHRSQDIGNMVILAADFELSDESLINQDALLGERIKAFAWQARFEPETGDAPVLTDDLNPVDLWSERINLQARRILHNYFKTAGLGW